jgi:hypothetical protein
MPCSDGYDRYDNEILVNSAKSATRAACDMRTILRQQGLLHKLTLETLQWINFHDQEDAARIASENISGERERTKQAAMSKLSLEERRVLGL